MDSINNPISIDVQAPHSKAFCTLIYIHQHTPVSSLLKSSNNHFKLFETFVTMDAVNSMIQEKPVVIFSKSSCCMSHSIESLMRGFGANPTIYQLDQIPNGQQIERELVVMGFRQSVPAVFIGQQLIGNERQVMSLLVQNQLVPLLKQAGAIWI
ncbi:hypothetical protein OIU77_010780 [Salix suchowensis]|nr:hypothetical protein OIU77_010780 [Salix suchowensis]